MTRNRRSTMQAAGIFLLAVGLGLGLWGYQESQSLGNEVVGAIEGGVTDEVMIRYVLGAGFLAAGLFLLFQR